jgi:outer membrane receptor protein involved in Fe transport
MMRKYIGAFIFLMIATTIVRAGVTGTITGKVLDESKSPVVGATVRVVGTTLGAKASGTGSFVVNKVPAGEYSIRITAVGFDTVTIAKVYISADQIRDLNVSMKSATTGKSTGDVIVTADRVMVSSTSQGSINQLDNKTLRNLGVNSVAEAVSFTPGIRATGNNFTIRSSRPEETQVAVDGLAVTDQFTGGLGNVGATISSAMPSPLATEQVQAITGGASAEYGGAVGGHVNTVAKSGRTDRYEGALQWRRDAGFLYGKAANGIQAMSPGQDVVDATFGGPLGFSNSTFFLSVRNLYENFRNASIGVIDPDGNNLGQQPNNRSWSRNLLGRMKFQITESDFLLVGTTYGTGSYERASWGWLYANGQGVQTDFAGNPILDANGNQITNGVPERTAKQVVVQEFTVNAFAQLSHTSQSTSYDIRASYNGKVTETGKRKEFTTPGIFTGWELHQPEDNLAFGDTTYVQGSSNRILDAYDYLRTIGRSEDNFIAVEVTKRNPLTGYVEGPQDAQSTNNPYGLTQFFPITGNEGGIDFRDARFWQLDGNITHSLEVGETRHQFKAGFEFRQLTLRRHFNASPWDGTPFYDVYGSENLYFDVPDGNQNALDAKLESEKPFQPITAGVYLQDQILFKGLVLTPGLRFDYLDAAAQYRTRFDQFYPFGADSGFANSSIKLYISPRITITYPLADDGTRNLRFSYGIYYQAAPFAEFYDSFNAFQLRGSQVLGNPNLEMQRTNQYEVAYNHQLTDVLAFTAVGYYKDVYNQPGTAYVRVLPIPFFQTVLSDYGSVRGIELTFIKRTVDNWGFNANYTLSFARGTANAAGTIFAIDPATQDPTFPVNDFFLSLDRRHRVNLILSLEYGKDEGPKIADVAFLQYFSFNLSGFWQSGAPYTPVDGRGQAAGEINTARFPSIWNTDLRIIRKIPLDGILSANSSMEIFLDATNLLNFVQPVQFHTRTGSPDFDGQGLNRQLGDFPQTTYFKTANPLNQATLAPSQYDRYGRRQYNARVDFNNDGRVSPEETFQGYERYVANAIARSPLYNFPRTVFIGVRFNF